MSGGVEWTLELANYSKAMAKLSESGRQLNAWCTVESPVTWVSRRVWCKRTHPHTNSTRGRRRRRPRYRSECILPSSTRTRTSTNPDDSMWMRHWDHPWTCSMSNKSSNCLHTWHAAEPRLTQRCSTWYLYLSTFLDPEGGSQKATLVVVVVVDISSPRVQKSLRLTQRSATKLCIHLHTFALTLPTDLYRLRFFTYFLINE